MSGFFIPTLLDHPSAGHASEGQGHGPHYHTLRAVAFAAPADLQALRRSTSSQRVKGSHELRQMFKKWLMWLLSSGSMKKPTCLQIPPPAGLCFWLVEAQM